MTYQNPNQTETTETAVPSWGPSAIDIEAEALIKQISSEQRDANLEKEIEGHDPIPVPVPEKAETAPASTESLGTVKAPQPELDRLIARELDLRDREAALKRQADELGARKPVDDEVRDLFGSSAVKALEKLGYDPDQIVRRVIAERMGEKAPDKLRHEIEQADKDNKYLRRIDEVEKKLAAKEAEAAQRAYFDHVNSGARDYVTKGIGEYAPTVASVARTNPDRVHREIMDELIRDAQVRAQKDPNGELLTFEEAAKKVESRWSDLRGLLSGGGATPQVTSTKTEPVKSTEKTPTIKPPDRPLAPWLQSKPIEEEGVKAGLAEYYRLMKDGEKA